MSEQGQVTMKEKICFALFVAFVLLLGVCIGISLGGLATDKAVRQEAIDANAAHFTPKGEFAWGPWEGEAKP